MRKSCDGLISVDTPVSYIYARIVTGGFYPYPYLIVDPAIAVAVTDH